MNFVPRVSIMELTAYHAEIMKVRRSTKKMEGMSDFEPKTRFINEIIHVSVRIRFSFLRCDFVFNNHEDAMNKLIFKENYWFAFCRMAF
jgi:hypothetical protein